VDDSDVLRELGRRLDYIEDYLTRLGRVSGFPYTPYVGGAGQGIGSFDSAPASFGQAVGFSGPIAPGPPQPASGPGVGVPPELVLLARSGKLIQAIQQYRQMTGIGLKEAKAAVEAAARQPY